MSTHDTRTARLASIRERHARGGGDALTDADRGELLEMVDALGAETERLRSQAPYVEWSGHYCEGMTAAWSDAQETLEREAIAKRRGAVLEAALADAIEGMRDMLPYVDDYFAMRYGHQGYIDRARAVLEGAATSAPPPVAALRIALAALVDLGACDDAACTEPNCLHAASVVRAALAQAGEEGHADG